MTPTEYTFRDIYMELRVKDGILYCRFSSDLHMDLKVAQQCVQNRLKFSNKKSYPALINMTGLSSVTKEAREYMAKEGAELITAGAFIVTSPLNRVIGNLFLKINKPKVPTRLFTDAKEAEKWLQAFISPN